MTRREALNILGLDSDASLKDVKNAYRKLVKHYHPDKNSAHNAEAMFRLIHEAYQYICNKYGEDITNQEDETEQQAEQVQRQAEEARQQTEAKRQAEESEKLQQTKRTIWYYCLSTWVLTGLYIIFFGDLPGALLGIPFGPILLPIVTLASVTYIVSSNTLLCLLVSPFITLIVVLSIGQTSYIAYLIINRSYKIHTLLGLISELTYNSLITMGIISADFSNTPVSSIIIFLFFIGLSSYIIHIIKTSTWAGRINEFIFNPPINYTILALGCLILIGVNILITQILLTEKSMVEWVYSTGNDSKVWVILCFIVASTILLRCALSPKIGNPFFED